MRGSRTVLSEVSRACAGSLAVEVGRQAVRLAARRFDTRPFEPVSPWGLVAGAASDVAWRTGKDWIDLQLGSMQRAEFERRRAVTLAVGAATVAGTGVALAVTATMPFWVKALAVSAGGAVASSVAGYFAETWLDPSSAERSLALRAWEESPYGDDFATAA